MTGRRHAVPLRRLAPMTASPAHRRRRSGVPLKKLAPKRGEGPIC
ncbi:hypothetical protein FHR83_003069 [Actinoplanes campanulatus]|uniref:Uncharacterized protein n=1 Tax=Actinoplanes campanulatus TaxID=113559 RepID=A0A7W5AG44_9ACTN|nr:hypothetical protein [Actinoplanes campanulatus]